MAKCGITNFIFGTECIGDSLVKINDNFEHLESYVCDLSADTINTTSTNMISLSYDSITRNLRGYINDHSVTNYKLAFNEGNYGFRNKLINGSFDFWQRGDVFSGLTGPAITYTADRWGVTAFGSTVTIKQEPFNGITPSSQFSSTNPEFHNPKYFLSFFITNAGTTGVWPRLLQRIENVKTLAGRTAVVSFYAYVTSAVSVKVSFNQYITTSPSPTTVTSSNVTKTLDPGVWKKYEFVITLPSSPISGATASYDYLSNEDYLQLCIDVDNNASSPVYFSSVQVEAGTKATAFEIRPHQVERSLCERFFEKSYDINIKPGSTGSSAKRGAQIFMHGPNNSTFYLISQFKTPKRAVVGLGQAKIYHPITGNFNTGSGPNVENTGAAYTANIDNTYSSTTQLVVVANPSTTVSVNSISTWHYTVDAEYI
jgi:hypothetical protein